MAGRATSLGTCSRSPAGPFGWVKRFYPEERPVREVAVEGFRMDRGPVTVSTSVASSTCDRPRHVGRVPADPADFPDAPIYSCRLVVFFKPAAPVPPRLLRTSGLGKPGARGSARGPGDDALGDPPPGVTFEHDDASAYAWAGSGCPPRPSGSTRPAAASRRASRGATRTCRRPGRWPTPGRASSRWQNLLEDGYERHLAGGRVPAERLRPLRHDRQRLGGPADFRQPRSQRIRAACRTTRARPASRRRPRRG